MASLSVSKTHYWGWLALRIDVWMLLLACWLGF